MGLKLERCDDPEVSATASKSPEEIGVLGTTGRPHFAVGGDDLARQEIVDRHAVSADQPADAAPEGEPADTGLGDDPTGNSETERVGFTIEIAKRGAALDAHGACRRVDVDGSHPREVDDKAIIAKGTATDVVAPASDGREQVVVTTEVDRGDDVGESRAAGYERRPFRHARVPEATGIAVAAALWCEQIALERGSELLDVQGRHHVVLRPFCLEPQDWKHGSPAGGRILADPRLGRLSTVAHRRHQRGSSVVTPSAGCSAM